MNMLKNKRFVEFLKEHGVHDKFIAYVEERKRRNKGREYWSKDIIEESYLLDAFLWECTPDRHQFWENINDKWMQKIEDERVKKKDKIK